jgi:2-polyprenyl-3-methyl-5-hydroxy-6-metoxy-1,4-benzoquinol methylase
MLVCYLCGSKSFSPRKGRVRDAPHIQILECTGCGLVTLDRQDQINESFYQESGLHGADVPSIESWLRDTEWDDERRFAMMSAALPNKRLLDFGCGAAGFLKRAQGLAAEVKGIELETRVREYWEGNISIVASVEAAGEGWDLITAFHVIEHLHDPRAIISRLAVALKPKGRMVLEVPNSNDALATLYDCGPFQSFTYWSQHLFLFNAATLERLAHQAGLRVVAVQHYQRYPLSNHLHWLSQGKSGGHKRWAFLDTPELTTAYASSLAAMGKTDTLIAYLEHFDEC